MQTRRNFFEQLGAILAAASVPALFIPKIESVHWARTPRYVSQTHVLKMYWSLELEQDLKAYHNINVDAEREAYIKEIIHTQFPNAQEVGRRLVKSYDPVQFYPKYFYEITVQV